MGWFLKLASAGTPLLAGRMPACRYVTRPFEVLHSLWLFQGLEFRACSVVQDAYHWAV